jgi:hypothetical protein
VPTPDTSPARARLALTQRALLEALVASAPAPAGFPVDRVQHQAQALTRKRYRAITRAHPEIVRSLGSELEALVAAYANENPLRTDPRTDDARQFARWLTSNGHPPPHRRRLRDYAATAWQHLFRRDQHRHGSARTP